MGADRRGAGNQHFAQQTLQPGEVRRMPVVFVIEKNLPEDVGYITMSYTFFAVEGRHGG